MGGASIIAAMTELPVDIYTAEQVRGLDRIAIEELGIPGYELMSRAGEASLQALQRHWPHARTLSIYCGAGNNAGDGYVLARLASRRGLSVRVVAVVAPDGLTGDAALAWEAFRDEGGVAEAFSPADSAAADVVVDALLGTGLDRTLEGRFAEAVVTINASGGPILALDLPSGLHADTGERLGTAVRAHVTITFVGLKQGLFLGSAPDYRGQLEFSGLGIPAQAYDGREAGFKRLSASTLQRALPARQASGHKGSHGSVLLVGGAPGMAGAIRLAAEAALRAGAGLVRIATHPDTADAVMAGRAEVMCHGIADPEALDPLLAVSDAVVLGPGLGQTEWARGLWQRTLEAGQSVVVDADGLNLLAEEPRQRGDWVLTPHPGEAARLLQSSAQAVQADRLGAVKELVARYHGVGLLKGAGTLVARHGDAFVSVCDRGNPGMGTAGMGDVLAGVLGALLVQTEDTALAAQAGVLLHALAGDDAAVAGERGLLAGDLMPHVRRWANPA